LKKNKRKAVGKELKVPMFVIGYAAPEPPPPGFLAAWFDQEYGGPLTIQLPRDYGTTWFEAQHGPWSAQVETSLSRAMAEAWRERLHWGHHQAAQVLPLRMAGHDCRDTVLHVTRLARGLTLLSGGTAYDTATDTYLNPSDWTDRSLLAFRLDDHLRIEQVEGCADGQVWFHTRGLSKFGLEDIETYRPTGLSERPVIEAFTDIADVLIQMGKAPNVGKSFMVEGLNRMVRVVRHRTDQSYSLKLNLREVEWE
jgi:hypothetical protein